MSMLFPGLDPRAEPRADCTTSGKSRNGWFKFFENNFGPDHPDNPLIESNHAAIASDVERERIEALNEFEMDKANARKKLRTASWGMMFYLVSGRKLAEKERE